MKTSISLQTLLRFRPFTKTKLEVHRVHSCNSQSIPDDILLQIGVVLNAECPGDALQMAVTSRRMFQLIIPVIYASAIFRCNNHCQQGLEFLLKHPYVAPYIRKLKVRCNSPLWRRKPDLRFVNEARFIQQLEKLAPNLLNLDTFIWEGQQMPERDDFWMILRESCPNLRHLGITVRQHKGGKVEPEILANSQVFGFRRLVSFTIVINVSYKLWQQTHRLPARTYPLPPRFWDFLGQNTDLEELNIETYHSSRISDSLADVAPLFELHFPKLRRLSLGSFRQLIPSSEVGFAIIPQLPNDVTLEARAKFIRFLDRHLSLERIYSGWDRHRTDNPWPVLPSLTDLGCMMPLVTRRANEFKFGGVSDATNLKSIKLLPSSGTSSWSDFYYAECLPNLTELTLWVQGPTYRVISGFRNYHPNLRYLDISSDTNDDSGKELALDAFSALSLPDNLSTLRITTRHRNDSNMARHAVLIFRNTPSLRNLTIRYFPLNAPLFANFGFDRVGRFQRSSRDPFVIAHEVFISAKGKRVDLRYRSIDLKGESYHVLPNQNLRPRLTAT
ncbi:hypothetical protein C8J56DRAFT_1117159 [Mycena floridula]|nr:hypothetical protein C8J56DRAFT_1117159 [Mycena floridula]